VELQIKDYIQPVKKIVKHHKNQPKKKGGFDEHAQDSRGRVSGVRHVRSRVLAERRKKIRIKMNVAFMREITCEGDDKGRESEKKG